VGGKREKIKNFLNKGGTLGSKKGFKGASRVDKIIFYYPVLFYYIN